MTTSTVAQQVFTAIEGVVGTLGPAEVATLKATAQDLADALTTIGVDRAAGTINDAQAQAFMDAAAASAKAVLEGQLGIAETAAKSALTAGLNVLVGVGLGAAGLGWSAPIIQAVIAKLLAPSAAAAPVVAGPPAGGAPVAPAAGGVGP